MELYLKQSLSDSKLKKVALGYFGFFLFMLILVDYLNMGYREMAEAYGWWLVVINIILSIIMALSTALLMSMSQVMVKIKGIETKGANMSFLSILFAVMTYGCTPCVIALFANIGITFSVIVLPWAGLPYKIMTLGIIWIGILWSYKDIMKGSCPIG